MLSKENFAKHFSFAFLPPKGSLINFTKPSRKYQRFAKDSPKEERDSRDGLVEMIIGGSCEGVRDSNLVMARVDSHSCESA